MVKDRKKLVKAHSQTVLFVENLHERKIVTTGRRVRESFNNNIGSVPNYTNYTFSLLLNFFIASLVF